MVQLMRQIRREVHLLRTMTQCAVSPGVRRREAACPRTSSWREASRWTAARRPNRRKRNFKTYYRKGSNNCRVHVRICFDRTVSDQAGIRRICTRDHAQTIAQSGAACSTFTILASFYAAKAKAKEVLDQMRDGLEEAMTKDEGDEGVTSVTGWIAYLVSSCCHIAPRYSGGNDAQSL